MGHKERDQRNLSEQINELKFEEWIPDNNHPIFGCSHGRWTGLAVGLSRKEGLATDVLPALQALPEKV
jgi:hypothetical protein